MSDKPQLAASIICLLVILFCFGYYKCWVAGDEDCAVTVFSSFDNEVLYEGTLKRREFKESTPAGETGITVSLPSGEKMVWLGSYQVVPLK